MYYVDWFPRWSSGKEFASDAGDTGDAGSISGLGRFPGGGNSNPLQYSWLENPHGQRSLASYSPPGCKESDMTVVTEHTHTYFYFRVEPK